MSILLPRSLHKQNHILQKSSFYISSCTKRLSQIQQQLQTQKLLHQQYVSSIVMKDNALKKLIQQKAILIFHLKQELKDLQRLQVECKKLESLIQGLQVQYVLIGQQKGQNLQNNYVELNRCHLQYKTLHDLLKQLSQQSARRYQQLLRYQQRHVILRQNFKDKTKEFIQLKDKVEVERSIKENKKKQNAKLNQQVVQLRVQNESFITNFNTQLGGLKQNRLKYAQLQAQVKKMQQQKRKLASILQAAQNDNNILKQAQKDTITKMKFKQQSFTKLTQQKQHLQVVLSQQKQHLNSALIPQTQSSKQTLHFKIKQNQNLIQLYESIIQSKYRAQSQIDQLFIIKQQQLKNKNIQLIEYKENREQFQRHLYFIDQYMVLNQELIREIDIMVYEDIQKQIMAPRYRSRCYLIQNLRAFLLKVSQDMKNSKTVLNQLRGSLNFYVINE